MITLEEMSEKIEHLIYCASGAAYASGNGFHADEELWNDQIEIIKTKLMADIETLVRRQPVDQYEFKCTDKAINGFSQDVWLEPKEE